MGGKDYEDRNPYSEHFGKNCEKDLLFVTSEALRSSTKSSTIAAVTPSIIRCISKNSRPSFWTLVAVARGPYGHY